MGMSLEFQVLNEIRFQQTSTTVHEHKLMLHCGTRRCMSAARDYPCSTTRMPGSLLSNNDRHSIDSLVKNSKSENSKRGCKCKESSMSERMWKFIKQESLRIKGDRDVTFVTLRTYH